MSRTMTPYEQHTLHALRAVITWAITEHGINARWRAPSTSDRDVLIEHIDEMCSEFALVPGADGYLTKS